MIKIFKQSPQWEDPYGCGGLCDEFQQWRHEEERQR